MMYSDFAIVQESERAKDDFLPKLVALCVAALLLCVSGLAQGQTGSRFTYDKLNRLVEVRDDAGRTITYQYDLAGNLVAVSRVNPVDSDLMAWWTFDECTAQDRSGNGNHGTGLPMGTQCVPGHLGQAVRLPGVGIEVPSSSTLKIDGAVTLTAIVSLDPGNGAGAGILQKGVVNQVWDYGFTTYSQAPSYRSSATDWISNPPVPNPLFEGAWHLFVAVVDEADAAEPLRLYVDGVALPPPIRNYLGAGDPTLLRGELINVSDYSLQLGVSHLGALSGLLDDVRIYRRALTAQQVAALAAAMGLVR